MATNNERKLYYLTCPVCSQEYKTPKFISCGHTVCMKPCLENLLQSGSPSCPVCSIEIQSTSSNLAENFPSNHVLEALLKRSESDFNISPFASKVSKPFKRKLCQLHEEILDKFCEICSEAICEKCVTEAHDQSHEITSLSEAAKKDLNRLEGIEQDINSANERLEKLSEICEKAKLKCHTDADSIKMEVKEAETWAAQLLNNCVVDISSKIDERKENILKEIRDKESQNLETSLFISYLKNICSSLKHDQQSYSVTSKGVVENLSRKTEKLLQDILQLEKTNVPDGIGLKFRAATSNNLLENRLGTLQLNTPKTDTSLSALKMWGCWKGNDTHVSLCRNEDYVGFTWVDKLSKGPIAFIINGGYRHIRGDQVTQTENHLYTNIQSDVSIISPNTDISGLSVLGYSWKSVYKISFDPSCQKPNIIERIIECADEREVGAVCWDENRTDCYALLKDGETIIRVNFSGLVRREFELKLEEPVMSVTSRQLHVSELGRMAICETELKRVRYYDSVKAKATKVVTAPPDINGWYPVFVITRKYDQRWFVAWETLSYEIEEHGVPYARIYQYNEHFDLEGLRFNLPCHKINAFVFEESKCDGNSCSVPSKRNRFNIAIEKILYRSGQNIVSVYSVNKDDG